LELIRETLAPCGATRPWRRRSSQWHLSRRPRLAAAALSDPGFLCQVVPAHPPTRCTAPPVECEYQAQHNQNEDQQGIKAPVLEPCGQVGIGHGGFSTGWRDCAHRAIHQYTPNHARSITLQELALESFFPADEMTAGLLRSRAGNWRTAAVCPHNQARVTSSVLHAR